MLWSEAAVSVAILFSVLATVRVYQLHKESRKSRKVSKEWGCKPARRFPSGPLGIKAFWRVRNAHKHGQVGECFNGFYQQCGNTMVFNLLGHDIVTTAEPRNIQAILASQFSSFGLSKFRHPQYQPLLGNGIFTSDGMAWEESRKLLRPHFTQGQIPTLEWFDSHFDHFMQALPSDGQAFDIQQLFFRLALDAATGYLFGESANSLVSPTANKSGIAEATTGGNMGFAEAFDYSQFILFKRTMAMSHYWLFNPKSFRKANHVVHQFVDYYVNKAIEYKNGINDIEKAEQQDYCFLQALAMETQDPIFLRNQMVNVLLASRDDVASVLSSVFYLLARENTAWQKLKDEVSEAVCRHEDNLSLKVIQNLPYLRGVVYEALRLFPPVPINGRIAREDTVLPVGGGLDGQSPLFVPKGQTVMYSVWSLHRRQDIWGADCESFQPERWEGRKPSAWEFLPCNAGPRACLGQQYALMLISHQTFRLVQHLSGLETPDGGPEWGLHPPMRQTLTMCQMNGVQVRVQRDRV